mmetsp:Transcript_42028/g.127453  ORF Transcript_42028/g.127453 Transcript_42028/m.127453 type:complete len:178 (+) Transcript_42028:2877-3410(+)
MPTAHFLTTCRLPYILVTKQTIVKTHREFWIDEIVAESDCDIEEGGLFYAGPDVHNDTSSKKINILEGSEPEHDSDTELEGIVIPSGGDHQYLQSIVPSAAREAREAWMTDMNFMKNWNPSSAEESLPDSDEKIPQENIHTLPNFRSAKLKLGDCFGHEENATSLFQNALKKYNFLD